MSSKEARSRKSEAGDEGKGTGYWMLDARYQMNGGKKAMSKLMRKLVGVIVGVVGIVMGSVMVEKLWAYSDAIATNNTAQLTITITPNVDRGVTITTTNAFMDLGTVDLSSTIAGVSSSTQTVNPSTVTITGTFGNTDLLLTASINSAGTAWSFDASSDGVVTDQIAVWTVFTGVSTATLSSTQDSIYFNGDTAGTGSDLVSGPFPLRVGETAGNGRFENGLDTNNLAVDAQRHMFMRFRMPSATTATDAQNLAFQLTVGAGL